MSILAKVEAWANQDTSGLVEEWGQGYERAVEEVKAILMSKKLCEVTVPISEEAAEHPEELARLIKDEVNKEIKKTIEKEAERLARPKPVTILHLEIDGKRIESFPIGPDYYSQHEDRVIDEVMKYAAMGEQIAVAIRDHLPYPWKKQ